MIIHENRPARTVRRFFYGALFTAALVILMMLLIVGLRAVIGSIEGFDEWLSVIP